MPRTDMQFEAGETGDVGGQIKGSAIRCWARIYVAKDVDSEVCNI